MNINRAGKQQNAFWRSAERHREKWMKEKPETALQKKYGQFQRTCERVQGFAAGWIAAIAWTKRNRK